MELLLHKLWFLIVGIFSLIVLCCLSLRLLLLPFQAENTAYSKAAVSDESLKDSPNVLTSGMFATLDGMENITSSAEQAVSNSLGSVTSSIAAAATQTVQAVTAGAYNGATFVASSTSSGARLLASSTESFFGLFDNMNMGSVIRPAEISQVPVIDPLAVELASFHSASSEDSQTHAPPQLNHAAVWPIHGRITTRFGVPHWPYQPTHSGIDISSGQRSGVTAVMAFKPGRVIEAIYSRSGLGNHVVVDHGAGVTSVYGHLHSISVKVGQEVNNATTIGFEGSTGVSTGTHLHFEIRVNGQTVNPAQFIRS